eukprot:scaffold306918_cov15-Tisochrysis_lutea.AAC.1
MKRLRKDSASPNKVGTASLGEARNRAYGDRYKMCQNFIESHIHSWPVFPDYPLRFALNASKHLKGLRGCVTSTENICWKANPLQCCCSSLMPS